ncbi:DinB family protein [Altibacter sp.]|uniref:DinB family protein n=1 Tax=Altibacter sp. TaxID=2024823 RepID=UPI000C950CA5|nr:DinB family protein [Altibacter sp.]MAP55229.1 damage-inducible protein DinB [Altibacter sp.]|tara:strand:+ start:287 stop:748 length:462 start_codon:yes stop_codon:yes gene_type:complete
MKDFFKTLFEYNHSCNHKMITLLAETPEAYSERAQTLLSHTFNAQHIWNSRILATQPHYGVWHLFERDELGEINDAHYAESLSILANQHLDLTVSYVNTRGEFFENSIQDILYHVINHSTYHRGQIMSELKLQGVSPIATDYIFYRRTNTPML